jgi:transposase
VDALTGSMGDIHRQLLAQHLDRIELIDRHIEELNKLAAAQMQRYQNAVTRLIEIPGIGAEAAQEILAEIGPQAAAFPSAEQPASWIGVCPGSNESAGENYSGRSAKGNRFLRRLAAVSSGAGRCQNQREPSAVCFQTPRHPSRICQGSLGRRSPDLQNRLERPAQRSTIHRIQ